MMKKYSKNYSNLPHFKKYFKSRNYNDDFGHLSIWNQEVEKWLVNIKAVDKKHYLKQRNRVKNKKQRDELLGEYKAIYFVGKILQLPILKIEPDLSNHRKNDFLFQDKNQAKWYVEVKSPSWEAEVFNDGSLSINEKIKRKKKAQFISGECRAVSVREAIEFSVKHSLNQFDRNNNNLLTICHNMFADINLLSKLEDHYKLMSIVNLLDKNKIISSICLLQPFLLSKNNKVKYNYDFIKLTKSIEY